MSRVSHIDGSQDPALSELISRLSAGRRGKLINVYRLLLHSPAIAQTWFDHLNAVRWKTGLPGRLREIIIIRIAMINKVNYVIAQHVPRLAAADGVSAAECEALHDWETSDLFSEQERAVLAYVDCMTRDVRVPDSVFTEIRKHFDERATVELSVLIGTYNMHNRVMQALEIDLEETT